MNNCKSTQMTLAHPVTVHGIGVHTGAPVRLVMRPSAPNSGVTWQRTDVAASEGRVSGRWDSVGSTELSTLLRNRHGVEVSTVEHLMAALSATTIDNVHIELDGPEVPILDGSALPWLEAIDQAGRSRQAVRRWAIRVNRPVEVRAGESYLRVSPAEQTHYSLEIDFPDPAIGRQRMDFLPQGADFSELVAPARTFGFLSDIQALRERGLTLGGSLDNAVVIDQGQVLNPQGLRFEDEFVRHKLLDLIGDMYQAGAPIIAHIEGHRTGHGLNNRLLHALFEQPGAWSWDNGVCFEPLPGDLLAA